MDATQAVTLHGRGGPSASRPRSGGTITAAAARSAMSSSVYGLRKCHSTRQNVTVYDAEAAQRAPTARRKTSAPNHRQTVR